MFDKIVVNRRTEHVPYEKTVTVHEHKAPTDESIKMLNEMQEKAISNIIKTINVTDNTINACVVYFLNQMDFAKLDYIVKFTFNGKEHRLDGRIDRMEMDESTYKYGSQAVNFALAKNICLLVAQNMLNTPGLAEALAKSWK